uniref:Amphiphysin n=1 Tax=Esox lucius TaxID=8010 RepID=A0A3P8YMX2_ESOLU
MAEIKTGIFAKNVQKRLSRAQEKVLQKLGKADETKDDHFDQAVQNFKRQETEGSRLQREMKAYLAAVKAMQQASINLTESLHEVYEPDWHGKDDVLSIGKNCDALWEDFHQKLVDSSLSTLDTYLQQFPDLKIRVAKRSRKLIDYDSARHHLETIQAVANRSDRKAEEELKKAQKVFDELNVGLQDELPTLWDSRVGFYVNTFKNVTSLEAKFHREISVLCRQLYEVMTKLGEQHSDKMFTIQGAPSDSGPLRLSRAPSPPDSDSDESPGTTPNHMLAPISPGPPRPKSPSGQLKKGPPVPPPPKTPTKELHQEQIIDLFGGQFLPAASPSQVTDFLDHQKLIQRKKFLSSCLDSTIRLFILVSPVCLCVYVCVSLTVVFPRQEKMPIPSVVIEPASSNEGDDDRDIVDIISPTAISDNGVISDSQAAKNINASDGPPGLPPGYLYKVETLHDFEAANSDELDLKRGDIVLVVPTATVEDQDAGWLTGIKESDWLHLGACAHQGLFPENFTQRLE